MSKGLEALHHPRIKSAKVDISSEGKHDIAYMFFDYTKQYAIIEKELKALEIIKNIGILRPYETCGGQCWLETMSDATKITKENYDLLKEILNDN